MKIRMPTVVIPLLLFSVHGSADGYVEPDPPSPTVSDDPVEIREWTVSWEPSGIADWPRDPYLGPDGKVWFAGQRGHYIGQLDPGTAEFRRWELEQGAEPHNVILDDDGRVWYAALSGDHIGRLDPASGEITIFPAPEGVRGAHTQVWDADGNMWFTAYRSGHVVKLDVATGQMHAVHVDSGTGPYGLVLDSEGRPWFTTMGASIGTIDPVTMEPRVYATPDETSRTRRLGVTSDDRIWWVDFAEGYFGVLDPDTGEMRQWQSPGGEQAGPYAVTVDSSDRVWYVETGPDPNRFIGFDTATEEFFSITEVRPSGGGTIRHMVYDAEGNEIWFATDRQTVGRASLPE